MTAGESQKVKSIALWAPVFNADPWRELFALVKSGNIDPKKKEQVMQINGQVPSMHFYEEFFDMNLEKDLENLQKVPVLHIHGERDELIKIDHADRYVRIRELAHAKTKFIRLPEGDHDFSISEDQQKALTLTVNWFAETLLTRGERWQRYWKSLDTTTFQNFLNFLNPFKRSKRYQEGPSASLGEKRES